jgi:hypothetical protein
MGGQTETTTPIEEKHSFNWRAFILWPFLIVLLYVLSFGPVVRMLNKTPFKPPNRLAESFYWPVELTYHNTFLHRPLGMYFHLWDPGMYDENGDERKGSIKGPR